LVRNHCKKSHALARNHTMSHDVRRSMVTRSRVTFHCIFNDHAHKRGSTVDKGHNITISTTNVNGEGKHQYVHHLQRFSLFTAESMSEHRTMHEGLMVLKA